MLHIHNGDSVAMTARRASLPGRHLPFRESLIAGPVPASLPQHEWIEQRARFLAESYDEKLLRVRNELLEQEQTLDDARHQDEVVLWFEHDLFCLVHFIYLLERLGKNRHLKMIWAPRPLGACEEEELWEYFNARSPVSPAMIRVAGEAWSAYTSDDATALNRFVNSPSNEFAFLSEGFRLQASRFPSVRNGLGEIERRAVEGIAEGANDFGSLFAHFDESPPRFGFGDGEFLRHLRRLATCAVPLLTITETQEKPARTLLALTPIGQDISSGKADFIELNNAGFWLGGSYLTRERLWRWDAERQEVIPSS